MTKKTFTAIACLFLLSAMAPAAVAVGPSDSTIWGLSYDWGHFEGDVQNMTGVDTEATNEDLEAAAEYAGFILESDQVLSGASHSTSNHGTILKLLRYRTFMGTRIRYQKG